MGRSSALGLLRFQPDPAALAGAEEKARGTVLVLQDDSAEWERLQRGRVEHVAGEQALGRVQNNAQVIVG